MSISNYLDSVARPFEGLAPWILRLVLGVSFILHGLGKFPLPPENMVTWFESMGIGAPEIVASLVAVGEVG
ncbi:MAG: DoxX family protein, partial [Rhodobacterales bacterium]|nr:DoxX family protein [Rhodobacterales bacterium]